jgi:predicted membrane protein
MCLPRFHQQGDDSTMNLSARSWTGIILIGLGILMLMDRLGAVDFTEVFQMWWPLLLVLWGGWILVRRMDARPGSTGTEGGIVSDRSKRTSSDVVAEKTFFGNADVKVQSAGFKGGKVSTVFGNSTIDLRGTTIAFGDQVLTVDAVFGKVEVLFPSMLQVKVSADAVLGSVVVNGKKRDGILTTTDWTSEGYSASTARLRVDASVVFGEVLVTQVSQ